LLEIEKKKKTKKEKKKVGMVVRVLILFNDKLNI
jgi:hypothetical protein